MERKAVSEIMMALLLLGVLNLAHNVQPVRAIEIAFVPEVVVSPAYPSANDSVNVSVSFDFYTIPPYAKEFGAVMRTGNVFLINVTIRVPAPGEPVLMIIHTDENTYSLGKLLKGIYEFRVYVNYVHYLEGTHYLARTVSFTVAQRTLTVDDDGPADFHTIQEAINNANEGDAISVRNGTYYEHVVVNKTISLAGESSNSVIIDGSGSGNAIQVTANNTAIQGFTIQNGQYGIHLSESSSNHISGNNIANNEGGIWLHYPSEHNSVFHNNFIDNVYQLYVEGDDVNIWDNGCEGNYWSDYNGTDLDYDGVGDTFLPWQGVDYCPLMNLYWNPADINHDLKVDGKDIVIVAKAFGADYPGHQLWNPHADINQDGKIDGKDLALVAKNFGKGKLKQF